MKNMLIGVVAIFAGTLTYCMQESTMLSSIDRALLQDAEFKAAEAQNQLTNPDKAIRAETLLQIPAKLALIARSPHINATDDLGNTRLHYAAFFANIGSIILLITAGADVTRMNNHEQDFLNILEIIIAEISDTQADRKRKADLIKDYQQLLQTIKKKNPAQRFGDGSNLLHKAVLMQDAPLVATLLYERVIDPNQQNATGVTPLHLAAALPFGDRTIVNQLLSHRSNPTIQTAIGNTALHLAAREFKGDDFVINKLLEYQASTEIYNRDGYTPIHLMLLNLQELIKEYAHMKRSGATPKEQLPAKFDEIKKAALALFTLLTHTKNKNIQDNFGNTALYYLILLSDAKESADFPLPEIRDLLNPLLEKLFLDTGTNPNIQNREGFTPLHAAVGLKDPQLVKLLMDKGANPQIKSFLRPRTNAEIRNGQFPPPNKTPLEMAHEIKKGLPSGQQKALGDIELMLGGENEMQSTLLGVGQQQQAPLSREPSPIPQEPPPTLLPKKDTALVDALNNVSRALNQLRKTLV